MWANRIQEQQLEINIPFYEIDSRFELTTIEQISIFYSHEIVETIFYSIPIDHLIKCLFHFSNLFFKLTFED